MTLTTLTAAPLPSPPASPVLFLDHLASSFGAAPDRVLLAGRPPRPRHTPPLPPSARPHPRALALPSLAHRLRAPGPPLDTPEPHLPLQHRTPLVDAARAKHHQPRHTPPLLRLGLAPAAHHA